MPDRLTTYLEDNMLLENMLDTIDLIFSFALRKLGRCCAAIESRTIRGKFGNLRKLLSVF